MGAPLPEPAHPAPGDPGPQAAAFQMLERHWVARAELVGWIDDAGLAGAPSAARTRRAPLMIVATDEAVGIEPRRGRSAAC